MDMVVKDTPDGKCIYCRKCTERHKLLEREAEMLCRKWGMDVEKLREKCSFGRPYPRVLGVKQNS